MNKPILIVLLVILTVISVFLFLILKREAGKCRAFSETECPTKLVCKSVYEYGLVCGKDGCKEGNRFKECSPRF